MWIYDDGREVPDTFLTAADHPNKYSMAIQSSHKNGPLTMICRTKATIHLSDDREGPPSRQYDYADIFPETPFLDEVESPKHPRSF